MTGEMARISDIVVVVVDLASTRMIYALVDGRTDGRAVARSRTSLPAPGPHRAGPVQEAGRVPWPSPSRVVYQRRRSAAAAAALCCALTTPCSPLRSVASSVAPSLGGKLISGLTSWWTH